MSDKQLTPGTDVLKGTSGADTFSAAIWNVFTKAPVGEDGLDQPSEAVASLTKGDSIDGGKGFDTLFLDAGSNDTFFGGVASLYNFDLNLLKMKNVERLVVTGNVYTDADGGVPPVDVSRFAGLDQIVLAQPSTFDRVDAFGNGYQTSAAFSGLTDQSILVDGASAVGLPYISQLSLTYKDSVDTAAITYADGGFGTLRLFAKSVDTLHVSVTGSDTVAVVPVSGDDSLTSLRTLDIDVAGSGKFVLISGYFHDLAKVLGADDSGEDIGGSIGYAHLTDITVTGKGGSFVDLTDNRQKVTFTGGVGSDAVLVTLDNTTKSDHFDGGKGIDVFGVSLADTAASAKKLTLSSDDYDKINAADKNFETLGIMGDFERQIVVDASKIDLSTILIGQDAAIGKIADDTLVQVQQTGLEDHSEAHLTLTHATHGSGSFTGDGVIHLDGGDPLGAGPFLLGLFGGFGETLSGTTILNDDSHFAKLVVTGTFDLEIDGSATWKDSAKKSHGVEIDASALKGTMAATGSTLGDTITGGSGADTLQGGKGDDLLDGGKGSHDIVSFADASSGVAVSLAKGNQDTGQGTDTLKGFEGILGSAFADTLTGGSHADLLMGGKGNDRLNGAGGDDVLVGGLGNNSLAGGSGDDAASYADAADAVKVSLAITAAQDTGGAGKDKLNSIENLIGSSFDDTLIGNSHANVLDGNGGTDLLIGGGGDDILYYRPDLSNIDATIPIVFDGGSGHDAISMAQLVLPTGYDQAVVSLTFLSMTSIEEFIGSNYSDRVSNGSLQAPIVIDLGAGDDFVSSSGHDTLIGGAGDDILDGNDVTASYVDAGGAERIDLNKGTATGADGHDTLQTLSSVIGSSFADTIIGKDGVDDGDFTLGGDDRLDGGLGSDRLTGGAGADVFVFDTKLGKSNIDMITDFSHKLGDRIELDHAVFKGLSAGMLDEAAFHVGASAQNETDRIIYDGATGALFFDADGSGKGAAIQFATLDAHLTISQTDFIIV